MSSSNFQSLTPAILKSETISELPATKPLSVVKTSNNFNKGKDANGNYISIACERTIYFYRQGVQIRFTQLEVLPGKDKREKTFSTWELKPGIQMSDVPKDIFQIANPGLFFKELKKYFNFALSRVWSPYGIENINKYGRGKAVLIPEGEKTKETLENHGILSTTFQAKSWDGDCEGLKQNIQELKNAGVTLVIFWPDDDSEGIKKAKKIRIACALVGMPCVILKPRLFWMELPKWKKIDVKKPKKNEIPKKGSGWDAHDFFQTSKLSVSELISEINKQVNAAIQSQRLNNRIIKYSPKNVSSKSSSSKSEVSITTRKEIEELRSQASNTDFDLLNLISLSDKDLIESGSPSGERHKGYKRLCYALNKTYNYLLGLGLATKNTPADCLELWANNSGLDNNHESRKSAFLMLNQKALATFDPDSADEKEVRALAGLHKSIAFNCKRAKIANPLESKITAPVTTAHTEAKPTANNNNSAVVPGWGGVDKTDYSTFSKVHGGWKRFASGFDDLHIVFDSALLKDATEATIALKDVRQKADNWLDLNNQELLEPYVGVGRTITITSGKNWTRENLIALGGFCKAKGAGIVTIDGKRFEYYQVEGELSLSGKELIHEPFLKPQYIIDLIDSEKAKAALIESTVGSNKTGAALCIALYYALKHNIPILWTAATRTLCHGTAARCFGILGYTLPVYDPDTWLTKKPSKAAFKGLIFCPDSWKVPTDLMEEYGIKDYILITDECSYTIYHSHFADTAIAAKRAKSLAGISNLMAGATLSLNLEANITKPCANWVESKIKGNILKIKNTYQAPRKFITWNQNDPYTMLNAMVDIKRKNPDATILNTTQAKELDSSLSPVNIKKYWIDQGFEADTIILLDSESMSKPDHPAYGIKQDKAKFDKFFSESIKGKIVIGNPSMFSTGTNINKHCIDYCFDILQGKGTPMAALQQPMRVRDREGLERHIFINNCGLDHPKYKGYSTEKIKDSIATISNRTNQEYEKLGGKADFSQLRSDVDSAEYAAHCQYLQTLFVKSYRVIAHGLMQREGWTLIDSDKWLEANVTSEEERIIKEDSLIKEAFREIKLEGETIILNSIKNSELISDDEAKNLRSSRNELSQEDDFKLARYDFHKSSLGLVEANTTNIMRWQDGYYKQLCYQFYFLKDSQQYLRLKESKNIEFNNKDGHTFDFDRLAKSNLAAYGFLRELGVDTLINEIRRIAKGESTENHRYLASAPVKCVPTIEKCQNLGLDPNADHLGIPLNVAKGSPLELIALSLKADPIKCYNLLGFTPDKKAKTYSIVEKLLEKFGYFRVSNGKKGKACKHYLILFDDAREDFFAHLLHQHKLSVYDANNPDHEYIFDLCCEGSVQAPITQDYKLVKNGLENIKQGEPTILDLLDIGAASPLVEKPQASLPNNVQPLQLSRQLTIPGINKQ